MTGTIAETMAFAEGQQLPVFSLMGPCSSAPTTADAAPRFLDLRHLRAARHQPGGVFHRVLPRLARGITIATDLPDLMPAAWIERHSEARVKPLYVRRLTDIDHFDGP